MKPVHLLDFEAKEGEERLRGLVEARGEPAYRQEQIREQVFGQRRIDAEKMPNLPHALREQLAATLLGPVLRADGEQTSRDGTRKFRSRLRDGAVIETVWIPAESRGTLCVSSQAGCPAACSFCATGAGGFERNLSPAEIIAQWTGVSDALAADPAQRITQIVFMGMGEPLLNYASLATALRLLTGAGGFRFSPRRITVSTVGIAPNLRRLAADFPQVRIALSLHSAVDATRTAIVPLNRRYPLAGLAEIVREISARGRRVSLEYVVLAGVNDAPEEAAALADFAAQSAGHINLIPFHSYPGTAHRGLEAGAMRRFAERVRSRYDGAVTIRKSRGLDIAGACGQLAGDKLAGVGASGASVGPAR
ncbi:MAG: 23S rRNA (adenine(2503)-C(2))-methyltransferase RlmN [Planctomycetes bacterium]|nr:23S rRNA (adenine(2503)-C(2))-methyltransferase RlmN [Planctomycetota bacterium]